MLRDVIEKRRLPTSDSKVGAGSVRPAVVCGPGGVLGPTPAAFTLRLRPFSRREVRQVSLQENPRVRGGVIKPAETGMWI